MPAAIILNIKLFFFFWGISYKISYSHKPKLVSLSISSAAKQKLPKKLVWVKEQDQKVSHEKFAFM